MNIIEEQQQILDTIASANDKYKKRDAKLLADYRVAREAERDKVMVLVAKANDMGIPVARIKKALGTKDTDTVKKYIANASTTLKKAVVQASIPAVDIQPYVTQHNDKVYYVTDSEGQDWEFTLLDLEDVFAVSHTNVTGRGEATITLDPTDIVKSTLEGHFSKGLVWK